MEVLCGWKALGTCEMWLSPNDNELAQPWDMHKVAGVGSMGSVARKARGGQRRLEGRGGP